MSNRKKPYDPRRDKVPVNMAHLKGQLGIPTPERAAKSRAGFDIEALAAGFERDGGVVRSRERAILTHPLLLSELYERMMATYAKNGQSLPDRVEINQTPSDRATSRTRGILWSYIVTRIEVQKGEVKIADYEGAPRSSDIHRLPLNQKQFDRRRFYAWVREQIGLACVTEFIDEIVEHDHRRTGDANADRIMSKADLGRELVEHEANDRDAKNYFDGGLAMASRVLAEAARDFVVVEKRHRDRIALALNKKIA